LEYFLITLLEKIQKVSPKNFEGKKLLAVKATGLDEKSQGY